MNYIPDPLHPAVVHFPVVLILMGTVTALAAALWRKGYLPAFAAVLLVLGTVGTWAAIQTGESDGGLLETTSSRAESLVEAHEMWAERTLTAAAIAAVAAVAAALLVRFPRTARTLAVAAVLVSFVASYAVYETGHRGGALVFRHGAGVNLAADTSMATANGAPNTPTLGNEPAMDEDRD